MKKKNLIECVPNFSEGRDRARVAEIVRAISDGPDVVVLDVHSDPDHNRSVVTFVASRERVGEAALRGMGRAAELIDLRKHRGCHPRIGATDVVPFVPLEGVSLADCVAVAREVGEEALRRFQLPVYLYGAAARRNDRKRLEVIRRGQFELLRKEIETNPARCPDYGPAKLHPTAGATAVGARKFLIAFNVNLNSADVAVAREIAKRIRESDGESNGGLAGVKAMGVALESRNRAQVSVNITDYERTSLETVFRSVEREAELRGIGVQGSEIVGLVPRAALGPDARASLRIENFREDLVLENRLNSCLNISAG